ncbi:hypothetical protein ACWCRD_28410 [Streptomyces sp. NPDC002092]
MSGLALRGRPHELYTWHEPEGRSRTSFERTFLLAAAVLRGDPIGHVYARAAKLTEQLDTLKVEREALEIISRDGRLAVAERVGQFALQWAVRHRRQTPLERIVEEWYKHGTAKELWPLAVELPTARQGSGRSRRHAAVRSPAGRRRSSGRSMAGGW